MLCGDHGYLVPEHAPGVTLKGNPKCVRDSRSHSALPQGPGITILLSTSTDLPILGNSHEWNYGISDRLSLFAFTQCNLFNAHPCCSMYQGFIPFCGQILFHWMDILHFFNHFANFADGYLGCFHNLAITDNAAMTIDVKGLFEQPPSVLLGVYLGGELLGHAVILVGFSRSYQAVFYSAASLS